MRRFVLVGSMLLCWGMPAGAALIWHQGGAAVEEGRRNAYSARDGLSGLRR